MNLKINENTIKAKINGETIEIPKDWEIKSIKDLYKVKNGDLIPEKELLEEGSYPVYSATVKDKVVGYVNEPKTTLRANIDIIVPSRGFSLGNAKLPKTDATSTQTTIMLLQKEEEDKNMSRYITNYLKANRETLFRDTKGTAIKQINRREIENIEVPIPEDKEQIKFISDILERQEELIELKIKELEIEKKKLKLLQTEILSGRIKI